MKRLGIVYGPRAAATLAEIMRASAGLCQPVLLVFESIAVERPEVVAFARKLIAVEVIADGDLSGAVTRLGLDGLVTFADSSLDEVDAVLRELALPGAAEVPATWDKLVQRQWLSAHGLTRLGAVRVDTAADFAAAVAETGLPAVLKPRREAGGRGLSMIHRQADVTFVAGARKHWGGLLLESMLPNGRHPSGVGTLADFVSVETFSTGDEHRHVALFDKKPISWVPRKAPEGADAVSVSGDLTPSRLPDADREAVLSYTTRCLKALGVRWRVTHTEIKLTPAGPELIEVNGRVGGFLNRLLRLTNGVDLVRGAVCLALAAEPPSGSNTEVNGWAMGLFPSFQQRGGRVLSQVGASELRRLPCVAGVDEIAQCGQERQATGFRMANLTLLASGADELDAAASQAEQAIRAHFAADLP
jgi:biotin carboxylase